MTVIPAGASDTFGAAAPMNEARSGHTATRLPDGRVLVVGGVRNESEIIGSAEIFDPATGVWSLTGSPRDARCGHIAVLLPEGRVLVAGGRGLDSTELYNPSSGLWTVVGSMTTVRVGHAASLRGSGVVVVSGGRHSIQAEEALDSSEYYDPNTGTWTAAHNLNAARSDHTSSVVKDELVIIGGRSRDFTGVVEVFLPPTVQWLEADAAGNSSQDRLRVSAAATLLDDSSLLVTGGNKNGALASAAVYQARNWRAVGSLNTARSSHTATLLNDGRVLAVGGVGTAGTVLRGAETYSDARWTVAANLGAARARHTATALPDGRVLIAGGYDDSGNLASCEVFLPPPSPWTDLAPMETGRSRHQATLLPDGKLLVAGGESRGGAEVYNPADDSWTSTGPFAGRERFTLTLLADGRVLAVGGYPNWMGSAFKDAVIYDPRTNLWSPTGSMQTARLQHVAVLLPDGKVLVAAGSGNDPNGLSSVEIFNPATGVWASAASMSTPMLFPAATLLKNGKVLVASGDRVAGSTQGAAEIYDPATGKWTSGGQLNNSYMAIAVSLTLLPDGRVLAVGAGESQGGGNTTPGTAEVYDPGTNRWTRTGQMPFDPYFPSLTLLPDGRVLATGELENGPGGIYDPSTNAWSRFNGPGSFSHRSTLMPDGRVVFTGGTTRALTGEEPVKVKAWNPNPFQPDLPKPEIFAAYFDATDRLVLQGSGFAGNAGGVPPVVTMRRLDNSQSLPLLPSGADGWSASTFTSQSLTAFPLGYDMVTLTVNGVQATSVLISRGTPEIAVEQPEGTLMTSGRTVDLGSTALGQTVELAFAVKNLGRSDLTGLAVSVTGADAADFSILSTPPTVLSGPSGKAAFAVRFTASSPGLKSAFLRVASNDADEGSFQLALTASVFNSAPLVTPPADQVIDEDGSVGPLAFTVNDAETPGGLTVTPDSSNPALIPASSVVVTGSGSARAVALTPLPGASGTAMITLTVSDGALQSSTSFQLTVNAVNDPPTLGEIADPPVQGENAGPQSIALTGVDSGEGSAQPVAISAAADNPGLFRMLTVADGQVRWQTAPDSSGRAVVTVTVNDGQGAANSTVSRSFTVKVLPTVRGEAPRVTEGNGEGTVMAFRVFIHSPQPEPVSVDYVTDTVTGGAGQAQPGSDFLAVSGKLVIPAGATEAVVHIGITGDTVFENDEELRLLVANPQHAFLPAGSPFVLTGLILNDDPQPGLAVTAGSVTEAPAGGPFRVWISATLSAPSTLPLTWTVQTRSGTALAGNDFEALGPVALTFAPGQTSKWVAVKVNGGGNAAAELESDEEFYIDFAPVDGPGAAVTSTATIRQLAIREFYPLGTGLFALRFPTGNGQTYLIDEAPSPSGPWIENSAVILGSGSQVTQVVFSSKRKSFFRVRAASLPPGTADVGP